MRYCSFYDESGKLTAIGTGHGGVEISEQEYNSLLDMIREKAELVNALYSGEITLADVPTEWQEEIQRRVDERIAAAQEADEDAEATDEDYRAALAELGVTVDEEN